MAEDRITTTASVEIPIAAGGAIKLTGDGIVIQNLTKPKNFIRIVSRGIEISQDDGKTWTEVLTAEGIRTEFLPSGVINMQDVTITDTSGSSFRWDKYGLSAYGFSDIEGEPFDLTTFVRMDKYGLYGIKQGGDYVVTSLEDIKEKAHFGVTWDGFFIKNSYTDGYVSITSDNDFQVVSNGVERIKIGAIDRLSRDRLKYGITINNAEGQRVFETNDEGNLIITGTIYATNGEFTGTIHANAGEFEGSITAHDGTIGGFIIGEHLYSGEFGTPGSVYLSSGVASGVPIGGSVGTHNWAVTAGDKFGVTTEGILYSTEAYIQGTIHATNGVFNGYINAQGGTFTDKIMVGREHEKYIIIDTTGQDSIIASSDYMRNQTMGWMINGYGDAIFNNISVRGSIKTSVFEYNEIQAVGGAFLFRPSTTIKTAYIDGNDLILTVEKPLLFRQDEWVKLSNYNTNSTAQDVLNSGGLTYVFKIGNNPTEDKTIRLLNAAVDFYENFSFNIDKDNKYKQEAGAQELAMAYNPNVISTDIDNEGFISCELGRRLQENTEFFVRFNYEKFTMQVKKAVIKKEIFFGDTEVDTNITDENPEPMTDAEKLQPYEENTTSYDTGDNDGSDINPEAPVDVDTLESRNADIILTYELLYMGNLSILDETQTNTAEPFVIGMFTKKTIYDVANDNTTVIYYTNDNLITSIYTSVASNFDFKIEQYITQAIDGKYNVNELEGGSIISFGFDSNSISYDAGAHNYGIGINSSDDYVNLPERAISLFESDIHPNAPVKVTYRFRGILGTLPYSIPNTHSGIYPYMRGTQGIYTDNMYIGDADQYLAFYTDDHGDKHLKISAKELVFGYDPDTQEEITWEQKIDEIETTPGPQGPPGEDSISVRIESTTGNTFVLGSTNTLLTCRVFQGTVEITNTVDTFTWIKYDKHGTQIVDWVPSQQGTKDGLLKNQIYIDSSDVEMKSIFYCEVTFA